MPRLQREIEPVAELLRDPERQFLTGVLLFTYRDAAGYCDCYARKLRKLGATASHIDPARSALRQAARDLDRQLREALWALAAVLFAATGAAVVLVFGLPPVLFGVLALLLVLYIAALIHLVRLWRLRAAFHRAQAALLQAQLLYYRLQHVSTCIRPFPGWQQREGVEPPAPEPPDQDDREVDEHLEAQEREAATGELR